MTKQKNYIRYDIRKIKEDVDVRKLVPDLGLQTNGIYCECPFDNHEARDASGRVKHLNHCQMNAKYIYCHVCGRERGYGDCIRIVETVKGCSTSDALKYLVEFLGGSGSYYLDDEGPRNMFPCSNEEITACGFRNRRYLEEVYQSDKEVFDLVFLTKADVVREELCEIDSNLDPSVSEAQAALHDEVMKRRKLIDGAVKKVKKGLSAG